MQYNILLCCLYLIVHSRLGLSTCPAQCGCKKTYWKCQGSMETFLAAIKSNNVTLTVRHLNYSYSNISNFITAGTLLNLESLNLVGNQFSDVNFGNDIYSQLTRLYLDNNLISSLQQSDFMNFPQLQYLTLSQNNIVSLDIDVFASMPSLAHLELSKNRIQHLPESLMKLSDLEYLNVSFNEIIYLSSYSFVNNTNLNILDLSNNNLKFMPQVVLQRLYNLSFLDLSSNLWHCADFNSHLIFSLQSGLLNFTNANALRCSAPDELVNRTLLSLVLHKFPNFSSPTRQYFSTSVSVYTSDSVELICDINSPLTLWTIPGGEKFFSGLYLDYLNASFRNEVSTSNFYFGGNQFKASSIQVAPSTGSLNINYARGSFNGTYTCESLDGHGNSSRVFVVYVTSMIADVVGFCMLIGLGTYMGGAFIVIVIASIQVLRERHSTKEEKTKTDEKLPEDTDTNQNMIDLLQSPLRPTRYIEYDTIVFISPETSPDACDTPVLDDEEYDKFAAGASIMETLDEVRDRLRQGVERRIGQVRERVQTIRDTGTYYMRSIRDTSSTAVHRVRASVESIRESSSHAVGVVRTGVAMSVGTVKSHVKSIKEFCGTGEMGMHTISTISVSTDVDTDEKRELRRTFTFV